MKNIDSYAPSYVPKILVNFIKKGIELNVYYELVKRNLIKQNQGILTEEEIKEDLLYLKDRLSLFYQNLGWNLKLIKILNN